MSIVDASVVLKWFVEEEGSDKAQKLQDDYISGSLKIIVPDLLLYEVANALRFNGTFDKKETEDVLFVLSGLGMEIIPVNYELLVGAVQLAYNFNITVYDAIYAELAIKLGTDLITADRKLFNKIEDLIRINLL